MRSKWKVESEKVKSGEKKYPMLCAWCKEKGIETILRMVDYPGSDGICEACSDEMMADWKEMNAEKK